MTAKRNSLTLKNIERVLMVSVLFLTLTISNVSVSGQSIVKSQNTEVVSTKKRDAPHKVMKEYKKALERYIVRGKTNNIISFKKDISDADMSELVALYTQMSKKQQSTQQIKFILSSEINQNKTASLQAASQKSNYVMTVDMIARKTSNPEVSDMAF